MVFFTEYDDDYLLRTFSLIISLLKGFIDAVVAFLEYD